MATRAQLHTAAEAQGIPLRTLDQVQTFMADVRKHSTGKNALAADAAAQMMLRHGRMTDEARAWLVKEYP